MRHLFLMGMLYLTLNTSYSQTETNDSIRHYHIHEVTVSASRTEVKQTSIPQKVEIINRQTIESFPSENLADLLKKSTNLDIVQYPGISSSFGMRGFSPSAHSRSYTLLLINGVPSASTNAASFSQDDIERIEIIKGPYSMLYGSDAMGGIINIVTRRSTEGNTGSLTYSTGTQGFSKYAATIGTSLSEKTSLRFGFSQQGQQSNYRIGRRNLLSLNSVEKSILDNKSYGDEMQNSKYRTHQATGQLMHRLAPNWTTSLDVAGFFADDIETPGNYWGSYGQSKKDINRINLIGNLKGSLKQHLLSLSPYYSSENTRNYSDNSDTTFVSLDSKVEELGFKLHDNLKLGPLSLLAGADFDLYRYQSERYSAKSTPANPYQPDYNNRKMALLLQLSYNTGGLFLNAGARLNHIRYQIEANSLLDSPAGNEDYSILTPSVGFRYTLPFNLSFKSSFGQGFSVPDAFKVAGYYMVSEYFADWDYWWVQNYQGNANLKPEKSSTIDVGINYTLPEKILNIDLTWFKTSHTDKIVENTYYDGDTEITSYINADKGNYEGLELITSSDIGQLITHKYSLELFANFTWMLNSTFDQTETNNEGIRTTKTYDMLYIRRCNGTFGINFDNRKGFSTRINGRYIGHRLEKDSFAKLRPNITANDYYQEGGYVTANKILEHPAHIIFDWAISYTYQKNKRLGINFSNLLDENYTEKDGYNMPGRMISGSFSFLF